MNKEHLTPPPPKSETISPPDVETLVILVEMGRADDVKERIQSLHPADVAELVDALEEPELKAKIFRFLDRQVASQVLSLVSDVTRQGLMVDLPEAVLQEIIESLDSDDAADLLGSLPREQVEILLQRASPQLSEEMQRLLQYPQDTAGGIMQTEYVAVPEDATVEEAIETIRSRAEEVSDLHNVFVIDHHQHLVGILPLRKLILARSHEKVDGIMDRQVISVPVDTDQEHVAQLCKKYDLVAVPVVDRRGILMGRITIDDVVDVLEEEASEDFYRLAGLGREEEPALESPLRSLRRRLPWLAFNLLATLASASVIAYFEDTIHTVAIAAAFMTIVAAQGGAHGVQTLTIIVRGLALGEVSLANTKKILLKELAVALGVGITLGSAAGLIAYVWKAQPLIGVVLTLAYICNILASATLATVIPLTMKMLKIDPAIASNVFVTPGTDIFGYLTFLGFLTLFLKYFG